MDASNTYALTGASFHDTDTTDAPRVVGSLEIPEEFSEPLGIEVVGDNVIVALLTRSTKTLSGIEIAGQRAEKPSACVVLGAGPEAHLNTEPDGFRLIERGDRLVAHQHMLTALKLADDRELFTLKPVNVIGLLPGA